MKTVIFIVVIYIEIIVIILGGCVRNFTVIVLFFETDPSLRDPLGVTICSLMSLCQMILTYQVFILADSKSHQKVE